METNASLKIRSTKFLQCKSVKDLAHLLKTTTNNISLLIFEPLYFHFEVAKKNGKQRSIEAPNLDLKKIQRNLVPYLNAIYYLNQSEAAHGYICKVKGSKQVKNIYGNAKAHLGNTYLLNMDFEDFFHQISKEAVTHLFLQPPFRLNKEIAHFLARICTYKERLPMGAPTSPVLSNFYTLSLDHDLSNWAINNKTVYTRYVDDLSFSSKNPELLKGAIKEIKAIGKQNNLKFNLNKIKKYQPDDIKIITGLVLNETVDIDPSYYKELDKDLIRLKHLIEVYAITGNQHRDILVKAFKQEIIGKINFISTIEGYESSIYNEYLETFYNALTPPQDLALRWTQFSNY